MIPKNCNELHEKLRIAEIPIPVDKDFALLQAVHTGGKFQLQCGLFGVGQERYTELVVRIGTQGTHSFEIQIG